MAKRNSRDAASSGTTSESIFEDRRLTIEQVAREFGVKKPTVLEWIREGILPAPKIGRQYCLWASTVRNFREAQEQRAAEEAKEKRRERERKDELARRRSMEPDFAWDLTTCLECAWAQVLTNRYQRLKGDVFCDLCRRHRQEKSPDDLTEELWERKARLLVDELNRPTRLAGTRPEWMVDHCAICGKPYKVSIQQLKDRRFYPWCNHEPPYPAESAAENEARLDDRVVLSLAQLEAQERNREEGFADSEEDHRRRWRVTLCVHCKKRQAVATLYECFIGVPKCRACERDGTPVNQLTRASALAKLVVGFGYQRCACGGYELIKEPDGKVILSWCEGRSLEERGSLAQAYAKRFALPRDVSRLLIDKVEGLEDLPF